MEQEEVFINKYPDIEPGWIYDTKTKQITSRSKVPWKNSTVCIESTSFDHYTLKKWASEEDGEGFVWQEEFEKATDKRCFLLRFNGSYIKTISVDAVEVIAEGTVTEVIYKSSIAVLVFSTYETFAKECLEFVNKSLEGNDADLNPETIKFSKMCYTYEGHLIQKRNMKSFSSLVCCLKGVVRLLQEWKAYENAKVRSWKFKKASSVKQPEKIQPIADQSIDNTSFFNKKVFSDLKSESGEPYNYQIHYSFGKARATYDYNELKTSYKIRPGWIYDHKTETISPHLCAGNNISKVTTESLKFNYGNLKSMASGSTNYVWKEEFLKAQKEYCFLLRYNGHFSEFLDSTDSVPEGTVSKVQYKRSVAVLVCSSAEESQIKCSEFVKDILDGKVTQLDAGTCRSCTRCFIYDGFLKQNCNMQAFNSVDCCLREVARLIREMEGNLNLKENSCVLTGMSYMKNRKKTSETTDVLPEVCAANKMPFLNKVVDKCSAIDMDLPTNRIADDTDKQDDLNCSKSSSKTNIWDKAIKKSSSPNKICKETNNLARIYSTTNESQANSKPSCDVAPLHGPSSLLKNASELSYNYRGQSDKNSFGEPSKRKSLGFAEEINKNESTSCCSINNEIENKIITLCQTDTTKAGQFDTVVKVDSIGSVKTGQSEVAKVGQAGTVKEGQSDALKTCIASYTVKVGQAEATKAGQACTIQAGQDNAINACSVYTVKAGLTNTIKTDKADTVKAGQSNSVKAGQSDSVKAGQSDSVKAGQSDSVKAGQSDSVKAGQSNSVKVDQADEGKVGQADTAKAEPANKEKASQDDTANAEQANTVKLGQAYKVIAGQADTAKAETEIVINAYTAISGQTDTVRAGQAQTAKAEQAVTAKADQAVTAKADQAVTAKADQVDKVKSALLKDKPQKSEVMQIKETNRKDLLKLDESKEYCNKVTKLKNFFEKSSGRTTVTEDNLVTTLKELSEEITGISNVKQFKELSQKSSRSDFPNTITEKRDSGSIQNTNEKDSTVRKRSCRRVAAESRCEEQNNPLEYPSNSISLIPKINKMIGTDKAKESLENLQQGNALKTGKEILQEIIKNNSTFLSERKTYDDKMRCGSNTAEGQLENYVVDNNKATQTTSVRLPDIEPLEIDPRQHQLTNHKKASVISYIGKQITQTVTEIDGIRKVEIGSRSSEEKGKVIVLLGATGSGKTTLVNLCANYYFGAQSAEEEKLFVVEPKCKTDRVTVYTFYPEGENQMPFTVVDTPGLNDSTGAEINDHVDALKSFLALACSQGLEIYALGFVAQAHFVRLTSSEKFVMDYVKSLFETDVEKHIVCLVTFSDNQKTPPVIGAMEQYGFKTPFFVKFNNTLLISRKEEMEELDRIYWKIGIRSWKKCLKQLDSMEPLSNSVVSSVKNEAFHKTVLNKFVTNLETEIRILIAFCNNKKNQIELYNDKKLLNQRRKLWAASTLVYNLSDDIEETKEMFSLRVCQPHFLGNTEYFISDVCLFLLLDKESSLRTVLMAVVSSTLKCSKLFHYKVTSNEDKKSLIVWCFKCRKYCYLKRINSKKIELKFPCNCGCPNSHHGSPPENLFHISQTEIKQYQIFAAANILLVEELSKYSVTGVEWTLRQIFSALQYNEPEHYRKDISRIAQNLIKFA